MEMHGNIGFRIKSFILLCFVFMFFIYFICYIQPVGATEILQIDEWKLDIWPEYDDPRLLVINEIKVKEPVNYPFEITFLVPKDAEIGMACEVTESGGHSCKSFSSKENKDYKEISFKADSRPTLFLEYYTNSIKGNPDKQFNFLFKALQNIKNLKVNIQKPKGATNFSTLPIAKDTLTDNQGFEYKLINFSDISANKNMNFDISYTKKGNNTSVVKQEVLGNAAPQNNNIPNSASASKNNQSILTIIFIGASIFFGFGIYSYAYSNRSRNIKKSRKF